MATLLQDILKTEIYLQLPRKGHLAISDQWSRKWQKLAKHNVTCIARQLFNPCKELSYI